MWYGCWQQIVIKFTSFEQRLRNAPILGAIYLKSELVVNSNSCGLHAQLGMWLLVVDLCHVNTLLLVHKSSLKDIPKPPSI